MVRRRRRRTGKGQVFIAVPVFKPTACWKFSEFVRHQRNLTSRKTCEQIVSLLRASCWQWQEEREKLKEDWLKLLFTDPWLFLGGLWWHMMVWQELFYVAMHLHWYVISMTSSHWSARELRIAVWLLAHLKVLCPVSWSLATRGGFVMSKLTSNVTLFWMLHKWVQFGAFSIMHTTQNHASHACVKASRIFGRLDWRQSKVWERCPQGRPGKASKSKVWLW